MALLRICEACGKPFTSRTKRSRHCSLKCLRRDYWRKHHGSLAIQSKPIAS